jgi:hypothetical protein
MCPIPKRKEVVGDAADPAEERMARYQAQYWSRFLVSSSNRSYEDAATEARTGRRIERRPTGDLNVPVATPTAKRPFCVHGVLPVLAGRWRWGDPRLHEVEQPADSLDLWPQTGPIRVVKVEARIADCEIDLVEILDQR